MTTIDPPPPRILVVDDEERMRHIVGAALRSEGLDVEIAALGSEIVSSVRRSPPDPSRARESGGSGLGLAIVAATVDAHGGTTTLSSAPSEGTTVRVELARDRAHRESGDDGQGEEVGAAS